jgi:hypothetical protein
MYWGGKEKFLSREEEKGENVKENERKRGNTGKLKFKY